jgi:hypothetical protein
MMLDNLPNGIRVYGDVDFRGKCPKEDQEQVTFFNRLRREYPDTWGRLALHPRNEGLKIGGHIRAVAKHRAEGMTPGASDIIIPARMSFVCEMKRRDRTLCQWQDGQIEYLSAAHCAGAFACVALGYDAAWQAFEDWLAMQAGHPMKPMQANTHVAP